MFSILTNHINPSSKNRMYLLKVVTLSAWI